MPFVKTPNNTTGFVPKDQLPKQHSKPTYPADHQPGMKVPQGGSMCANCKFLGDDRKTCTQEDFVKWNGSDVIPGEIEEYCSDFYEPADGTMDKE